MVFFVAFNAFMAGDPCVIAFSRRDTGFEFMMTIEAAIVCHRPADSVAPGTIAHPLKVGVGGGEFARRYLPRGHPEGKQADNQNTQQDGLLH